MALQGGPCRALSKLLEPGQGHRRLRGELLDSERWQRLQNEGARPQRMLWASTGTKDPDASDVIYIKALQAPFTASSR